MSNGNPLLRLHIQFTELCANGVITGEEHSRFEMVLQSVLDRRGPESVPEVDPFRDHSAHE